MYHTEESFALTLRGHYDKSPLSGISTEAQVRYFQVMLDVDGDGQVTYDELVQSMSECRAAGVEMRASATVELPEVLRKLARFMENNGVTARQVFDTIDQDKSGGGRRCKLTMGLKVIRFQDLIVKRI